MNGEQGREAMRVRRTEDSPRFGHPAPGPRQSVTSWEGELGAGESLHGNTSPVCALAFLVVLGDPENVVALSTAGGSPPRLLAAAPQPPPGALPPPTPKSEGEDEDNKQLLRNHQPRGPPTPACREGRSEGGTGAAEETTSGR